MIIIISKVSLFFKNIGLDFPYFFLKVCKIGNFHIFIINIFNFYTHIEITNLWQDILENLVRADKM